MATDYEYSDEHMRAVYSFRAPESLTEIRAAHWDEFIRRHDERILREAGYGTEQA